jgi:hypothetical protein
MHGWRNVSETEVTRMVFVVLPAEEVAIGGDVVKGNQWDRVVIRACR